MAPPSRINKVTRQLSTIWNSPRVSELRAVMAKWQKQPYSGIVVLVAGTVLATLLVLIIDRTIVLLPSPGLIYLPVVALLAYRWSWRYAVMGIVLELICVYLFRIPP